MKEIFAMLRPILLVAALICTVAATCVGFEIIEVERGKAMLLTAAWGFWGVACYVASRIAGELAA